MSQITTHILDTALGKPARGVAVELQQFMDGTWKTLGKGVTNRDGRITDLLDEAHILNPGNYRMKFMIEPYFRQTSQTCFYPEANVIFKVNDGSHYHIPLLLSPYAYSTYRGS